MRHLIKITEFYPNKFYWYWDADERKIVKDILTGIGRKEAFMRENTPEYESFLEYIQNLLVDKFMKYINRKGEFVVAILDRHIAIPTYVDGNKNNFCGECVLLKVYRKVTSIVTKHVVMEYMAMVYDVKKNEIRHVKLHNVSNYLELLDYLKMKIRTRRYTMEECLLALWGNRQETENLFFMNDFTIPPDAKDVEAIKQALKMRDTLMKRFLAKEEDKEKCLDMANASIYRSIGIDLSDIK